MSTHDPGGPVTSFAPRDPETFFKAQKRNRRATWRMSALGIFAAFIMGIPLTLALTPLLYAVTLVGADIINQFSPLPAEFWQQVNAMARLGQRVGDYFINHKGTLDPQQLLWALGLFLLPGMVLAFVLWLCMLVLFRRGGVGGALASLNAREPNSGDLKELQLADAAQEMAIAAGLPAPKLMLVDSHGANAAAIGTSPHDARIVISRRLLDDLNRDQLQALLANLVSSIGNGDLRIAFTVTSVFETCGLLVTLINSPFGRQSQKTLWRVIRYGFRGSSGGDTAKSAEAEAVAELLAGSLEMNSTDIDRFFNSQQKAGVIRKFLRFVFFPIVFTNMAIEITLWFFNTVLMGPSMALVWRTRRYLADAGAVELTRNPDALAGALERLAQDSTAIPGGAWATHLFVVNPAGDHSVRVERPTSEQMKQAVASWAASAPGGTSSAVPADYTQLKQEMMATGLAAFRGDAHAAARVQAFVQTMAAAHGDDAASVHVPNIADIAAATRGDRAAIDRIHAATRQNAQLQTKSGQTGLQSQSFLSFHPPLKKRLRRLERMGAQFRAEAHTRLGLGAKMFAAVLWLIIGPLLAACAAMMLVVIAMIIGLNLVFLTLWLAVIHWAFAQNWVENFNGFMRFVNDVVTALGKAKRSH